MINRADRFLLELIFLFISKNPDTCSNIYEQRKAVLKTTGYFLMIMQSIWRLGWLLHPASQDEGKLVEKEDKVKF